METLLSYLNALSRDEQAAFSSRCKTTVGYLRKAISIKQRIGSDLCILLERESCGNIRCEDIRPDVDWAYLRQTPASRAPAATETVAQGVGHV
jgi:DNA-binding transcriptional regulator YdaS (Cro superfamily)